METLMTTNLNDPQRRREFRRKLTQTGLEQVRHLVSMKNHYNRTKQAVAEQWLRDVESGAIVEDDLRDIIDDLEALRPKYVNGGNMTGLFLRHEDEATALRLYTEAMALLDQRFGNGNQHTRQLTHTINNGSGGFASDGPSLACLTSTIELIRGFVKISERTPRTPAPSQPPLEPQPGDYPLDQLPSYSSFHLQGLSDDDLARYVAGWKPGTENHIIGTRELERRKNMTAKPSPSTDADSVKSSYVDPARLAEIEALPSTGFLPPRPAVPRINCCLRRWPLHHDGGAGAHHHGPRPASLWLRYLRSGCRQLRWAEGPQVFQEFGDASSTVHAEHQRRTNPFPHPPDGHPAQCDAGGCEARP